MIRYLSNSADNANRNWGYCLEESDTDSLWNVSSFDPNISYCFKNMLTGRLTWREAEASCVSIEGHLLSITSPPEYQYIANKIEEENIGTLMWLGLNDIKKESFWEWSDGSAINFVNWQDGQPNNYQDQGEDCVAIVPSSNKWGDTPCNKTSHTPSFICKKVSNKPPQQMETGPNLECAAGWNKIGNKCYMVTEQFGDWDETNAICRGENAVLAEFDTLSEVEYTTVALWLTNNISNTSNIWFGLAEELKSNDTSYKYFTYGNKNLIQHSYWDINQPVPARVADESHGRGFIYSGRHCAEFNTVSLKWSVVSCRVNRPGLCTKSPTHPLINHVEGPCGSDKKLFTDPETDLTYCYQVVDSRLSMSSAKSVCQNSIATVRSRYEQEFIRTLLMSTSNSTNGAWISVYAKSDEYNINGTKTSSSVQIEEEDEFDHERYPIVYTNWDIHEPKPIPNVAELCTYITSPMGLWKLDDCENSHLTICKVPLLSAKRFVHQAKISKTNENPTVSSLKCPPDWIKVEHNGKLSKCIYPSGINYGKLKLHSNKTAQDATLKMNTFEDAKQYCTNMHINTTVTLASFPSIGELSLMATVLKDYISDNRHEDSARFWVGLQKESGHWVWPGDNDEALQYHITEPTGNDQCAVLNLNGYATKPSIAFQRCGKISFFLCEMAPIPQTEIATFNTPAIRHIKPCINPSSNTTGWISPAGDPTKCYYFSDTDNIQHWGDAKELCKQNGSELVSVLDQKTQNVIDKLAQIQYTFSNGSYVGLKSLSSIFTPISRGDILSRSRAEIHPLWIGLTKNFNFHSHGDFSGNWQWPAVGAPLNFAPWDTDEPKTDGLNQCAQYSINYGTWFSGNCGKNNSFICEYDMNSSSNTQIPPPKIPKGFCPKDTYKMGDDCFAIFPNQALSFDEAQSFCQGVDGRNLASFTEEFQVHYLLSQMCNDTDSVGNKSSVWIGLKGVNT